MCREFDAIIFGATGFTGQYVVEETAITMNMDSMYKTNNLKWAVAGRNGDKIKDTLRLVAERTRLPEVNQIPIILANTDDYNSLLDMCKRTRLIITVVGPYRFFGEPLVKACVEAATNYVDISGEPQFLEEMQLKYHEEAKKKGVFIVGASGWDSVPADVGLTWTKQQFEGDLNGVNIIVDAKAPDGAKINYGTWHSAIYGYACADELKPLRQRLFKEILMPPKTRSSYKLPPCGVLKYLDDVKGYCLPFPGSDKSVVRRSEVFKYNHHHERPVQCETYVRVGSFWNGIMVIVVASVFGIMAKVSLGRSLLKKFPKFFSFGIVSTDGIARESLLKSSFSHTIIGYGWDEKLADIDAQHDSPPSKKIITKVSGPDPGYIATSTFLVHSGMTLLFDREKLPGPGGVLTPGACFRDSYLINRLTIRNIKFEVIDKF